MNLLGLSKLGGAGHLAWQKCLMLDTRGKLFNLTIVQRKQPHFRDLVIRNLWYCGVCFDIMDGFLLDMVLL